MSKQKACRECKTIYEGSDACPACGSKEFSETIKGRIVVLNPEKSEIAQKINLKKAGNFAIKNR
jgi:DNA-directed RNA polymerase subunit E"